MAGMSLATGTATDRRSTLSAISRATGVSLSRLRVCCTLDHFNSGTRCDAGNCMFWIALAEKLGPGFSGIRVDIREIRFSHLPSRLRFGYVTPSSLAVKIRLWDEGALSPEELPFSYVLSSPRIWRMADRRAGGRPVRERSAAEKAAG